MKKNTDPLYAIALFTTTSFIVCLIFAAFFIHTGKNADINTVYEKKYVYVDTFPSEKAESDETSIVDEEVWIVKEYFGKIGIFSEDGRLTRTIEVYTKTLPKADRDLLREGIVITSKESLEALIEDYTG